MIYIHINIYTYTHSLATLLGTPCLYGVWHPFAFRTALISCSLPKILILSSECCSRNQTHPTRQRFYNLLLSNSGDPVWIVSSVCCSYLTGAAPGVVFCCWSTSASGFDVLCVQRCILQILVVTSSYLSYCCLSIISNQSVHSPLTSDINKAFSSTQLPLTGYFLFFRPFSVNPRDGCVWKSQ